VVRTVTFQVSHGFLTVFLDLCKGCGLCMAKCPQGCLTWSEALGAYGTPSVAVEGEKCRLCGNCQLVCPDCAIAVEFVPRPRRRHRLKAF